MKIQHLLIVLFFGFSSSQAMAIDGRVKALGTMAAYGTVGGALLGAATLAFDGSGRNVARGASLGLYSGLIFGTYVVVTHALKNRSPRPKDNDYYPDGQSPYDRTNQANGWGVFGNYHEEMFTGNSGIKRGHIEWSWGAPGSVRVPVVQLAF